jgi:NADP-dependent 3-hydroxy acid dehydrogenase YdfG
MSAEDRARMVQPEDMGEAIWFVAAQAPHVCLNQIIISPTWNRQYVRFHQASGPE